jgi:hypothetical protein
VLSVKVLWYYQRYESLTRTLRIVKTDIKNGEYFAETEFGEQEPIFLSPKTPVPYKAGFEIFMLQKRSDLLFNSA